MVSTPLPSLKIAFVTPWYGQIPGGMEFATRHTAEHLARRGVPVEVLTTCIKDFYADWGQNFHRPGVTQENGVTVRRFAVEKRHKEQFDALNWRLMHGQPLTAEQEKTFIEQFLRVPSLYQYISQHQAQYLYFFIPYMFPTSYFGAQVAPGRAIIIPCLHDESYAYLSIYKTMMSQAAAWVFLSEAERQLAHQLYGPAPHGREVVAGVGVENETIGNPGRFRQKYGLGDTPFLLYAGRREPGKNTPLLLDYWGRYVQEHGRDKKLVLVGSGAYTPPAGAEKTILDCGFVPNQDKIDAYTAAAVTCQPSVNESFSITMMESWLAGTPTLVHEQCEVTKQHTLTSQAGLYFANYDQFSATLNWLFDHPDQAQKMGENGRWYVQRHFTWDVVTQKYLALIQQVSTAL